MVLPRTRRGHGKRTHKTHCRNRDFVLPRKTTGSFFVPSLSPLDVAIIQRNTNIAVIAGVELALQILVTSLTIYDDFELIVKQLCGDYSVKKAKLIPYH